MRQDFQTGMGLAQGFMQNYWKAKEGQIEQERYRAGQALRDVQLSLYQTNLETVRNAAVLDAQAKAAVPEFMGLMARSQVRSYDDDSQRLIFEFAEKNPAITRSPLWKLQMDNYDGSKKAQREKDALDQRMENEREVARIRADREVVDKTPKIIIDQAGRPLMVTAGGATEVVDVFTKVERINQESKIRELNAQIASNKGVMRDKLVAERDAVMAEYENEEKRRNDQLVQRVKGIGQDQAGPTESETRTWQQMIAGQAPDMVGQLPTNKPNPGFKIRLKGQ